MSELAGFPQEGLDFLTTLGNKDKAWFDKNRQIYDAEVVPHAKAFVVELAELLADRLSGGIEGQPKTNGSIAPINNDLRFNPDAAPYKDHLMFRFWEGPDKKAAAQLWVRMHPTEGVGFASGINIGDVAAWRRAIDEQGEPLAAALAVLVKATNADVVGEALKRVPKPYDEDHPRAGLLRHKGFQVRWIKKTPKTITTVKFADWCAKELQRTSDVHRWLVDNLV